VFVGVFGVLCYLFTAFSYFSLFFNFHFKRKIADYLTDLTGDSESTSTSNQFLAQFEQVCHFIN
jgi:hypothetical protein